jgi:hypothetical protein
MDAKKRLENGLQNLCGNYENQQLGVSWEIAPDDLKYYAPQWKSETPPAYRVVNANGRDHRIPLTSTQYEQAIADARYHNGLEAQRCLNEAQGWAEAKRGAAMSPVDGPITWGRSPRYYTDQREKANPLAVLILVGAAAFVLVGLVMIVVGALHSSGVISL